MARSVMITRLTRRARQYLVPLIRRALSRLPERCGRTILASVLRLCPGLWGWSTDGYRWRLTRSAYQDAFPHDDVDAFMTEIVMARASAFATSMTYLARTQADRHSDLIEPLLLADSDETPSIVTYLHYAIDPSLQVALLAANHSRDFRWVVYPPPPHEPLRWEHEPDLYLAGSMIPHSIFETMLPVTESSWLITALRHVRYGGSILIALDAPVDSRRAPVAWVRVGQAAMPISPAIDLLAGVTDAQLLFVWPERRANNTWTLQCQHAADTTSLAATTSRWIDEHRIHWAGWSCLNSRVEAIEMRRRPAMTHRHAGAS
jgi:hypothetical protein